TSGTTGSAGSSTTGAGGSGGSSSTSTTGSAGTGTGGSTGSGGTAGTTIGTGGADGSAPPGPSICDGAGTRILGPMDGYVDNFEEPALLPGWAWFNNVAPAMPDNSIPLVLATGGALGTGHAGHYAGTGARTPVAGGFGVGLIFNEAIDPVAHIFCV